MRYIFIFSLFILSLQSCITPKSTIYLQSKSYPFSITSTEPFEPIIKKDNILSITVSAENLESVSIFNLVGSYRNLGSNKELNTLSNITYLVDNYGYIDFPVIGKIKADGLKKSELETLLLSKISDYVEDPKVYIRIVNYRYYVLGEVNLSGEQKLADGERVTLLEAISRAGDLTINGNRKKIKIVRQKDNVFTTSIVDITNPNFISSEFLYLQQNDIIYVEPNRTKIAVTGISPIATTFSIITGAISLFILIDRL
jgi:polysaccharide export outer membrane protein